MKNKESTNNYFCIFSIRTTKLALDIYFQNFVQKKEIRKRRTYIHNMYKMMTR